MKPFLRWAGSKIQLLPNLQAFWSDHYERYVEPFAGSASLFFRLQPKRALLSDINRELILTLQQVRQQPTHVVECLRRMPRSSRYFYEIRAQQPETLPLNARAARFIYLNALCFNGLYRTNLHGVFNVPYGSKHKRNPFDLELIRRASTLLQHAQLLNDDFEDCLQHVTEGDFVYLDPPYINNERRTFQYAAGVFSSDDLDRLFAALHAIDAAGAHFVLSYANVREMSPFKGCWRSMRVTARRNIAGFAADRKLTTEILITNIQ